MFQNNGGFLFVSDVNVISANTSTPSAETEAQLPERTVITGYIS